MLLSTDRLIFSVPTYGEAFKYSANQIRNDYIKRYARASGGTMTGFLSTIPAVSDPDMIVRADLDDIKLQIESELDEIVIFQRLGTWQFKKLSALSSSNVTFLSSTSTDATNFSNTNFIRFRNPNQQGENIDIGVVRDTDYLGFSRKGSKEYFVFKIENPVVSGNDITFESVIRNVGNASTVFPSVNDEFGVSFVHEQTSDITLLESHFDKTYLKLSGGDVTGEVIVTDFNNSNVMPTSLDALPDLPPP
jgi:hypothetical protein